MTWNEYKRYLMQSYDQFIAEHQIGDDQIDKGVRYEKITDVDCVRLGYGQHLFFKAGQLRLIYISGGELATRIWEEFERSPHADAPRQVVRSRAGKTAKQIVVAEQGITASIQRDEIDFLEIYPPLSPTDYLANIYREPKPFIR
ncbi:hypothetical protein [Dawidia soli]|uniref:Uncharacterized protein n=1 Tax=Dawidia soli TaxID=2782352 RepID=A0AAP2GFH9_9BACT|nr:hypothetical protein [Dawidia soli]MBT1689464.1 hypothetical protein [Dawidia soli]